MVFEDRILKNPKLFRLKDPRTNEIVDFEIQDLKPDEIVQNGTEVNAEVLNRLFTQNITTAGTDLNNYTEDGTYYFSTSVTPTNIPAGSNGFLRVMTSGTVHKQIWYRHGTNNTNDFETYIRLYQQNGGWSDWVRLATYKDLYYKTGDTESWNYYLANGHVTTGTTTIQITIVTSKSLEKVSSVSVTSAKAELRGIAGYLNSASGSIDLLSNYTITTTISGKNTVKLNIIKDSIITNTTNNTPVSVAFSTLTLKFA